MRTPAPVRPSVPVRATSVDPFPLLSASKVLESIVALSRAVGSEMAEGDLGRALFDALCELLPGRLVAVRTLEPRTLATVRMLANGPLVDGVERLPVTIQRGALEHRNVRENLPPDLPRAGRTAGLSIPLQVVDEPLLVFAHADAGFSVPLLAGGEISGEFHINYRDPRGEDPADAWAFPIRADKGLVIPIANHVAVVSHTRRLLHQTAYLQNYLEQIVDQANVLIAACDLEGRVTVWNRAMTRITGFSRAEAVGKDLVTWLTEIAAPQLGLLMRQVGASLEPATRELRLPSADGVVLRAAFSVVIVNQAETAAAVLAIGQDVTALRALQNQVVHQEKLATLGQIAAGVAHEINNPLTSIQVCAEAVARKAALASQGRIPNTFDAADVDRLGKIKEGAERIRRFAKDLVNYARPSGAEPEQIDLNEVVEQALSFCEHVLDEAHATTEQDLHPGLPAVLASRDQILQVVINLATNAAQALPPRGGVIRVRTWRRGEASVGIAISDTGKGIRDEDRPHVFEPFFTTKPPGRGTGLGLSIVRNIVYAHGGQITFQSRQGGGTTFVVTLPVIHQARRGTQGDG
jgi:PAS domain S-box-containing protein